MCRKTNETKILRHLLLHQTKQKQNNDVATTNARLFLSNLKVIMFCFSLNDMPCQPWGNVSGTNIVPDNHSQHQ